MPTPQTPPTPQTALETAQATAKGIVEIGTAFMTDGKTYARGAELGFSGLDFYVAGRGGVLGEVDADVVVAAFGFFEPNTVRTNWETGRKVRPLAEAAQAFAECGHRFAQDRFPADVDAARLAELAGRVVESADPAGAPLFAGWRHLPVPDGDVARAQHHLNGLRELRGALHLGAVLATGMRPLEALLVKSAYMAPIFGWTDASALPDVSRLADTWQQAEDATNRDAAPAFEVLDGTERAELVDLVTAAHRGTKR